MTSLAILEHVAPRFDHLIGNDKKTIKQYGIIGETVPTASIPDQLRLAMDLDNPMAIAVYGSMGSGKSYLLGVIMEMLSAPISHINNLIQPAMSVVVHCPPTEDQQPEWTAMANANSKVEETGPLWEIYGARPQGITNQLYLCPPDLVEKRRKEYPHLNVQPLVFSSSELDASSWLTLMGAVGPRSPYLKAMGRFMSKHRDSLTLEKLKVDVEKSRLSPDDKDRAAMAIEIAERFIDESRRLSDLLGPGLQVIVDLRDDYMHPEDKFGIVQVVMQIMANVRHEGKKFPKNIVLDEVHNYGDAPALWESLRQTITLIRHKRTTVVLASQEPLAIPNRINDLVQQTWLGKMSADRWFQHILVSNRSFENITITDLKNLKKGQFYVSTLYATEHQLTTQATLVQVRTRVSEHGGATVLASAS